MAVENTILRRFERIANLVGDDFVTPETKLFYLNQAKQEIVAYYITQEINRLRSRGHVGSLRILDALRKTKSEENVTPSEYPSSESGVYKATVALPSDLNRQLAVHVNGTTPATEITPSRRYELLHRMGRVGMYQASYEFLDITGSVKNLIVYTGSSDAYELEVSYIRTPNTIDNNTTTLDDIPDHLQTALYIGAGWLLSVQDRDRTINEFTRDRFFHELQSKMY